jgi:nucleotide-binding universal stress UspA family protein
MKILIALDTSPASTKVVDYLIDHRALFGTAALTCAYIHAPPPLRAVGALGADPGMPPLPPLDPDTALDAPLGRLRAAGYAPDVIVREGEPGPELAQIAEDGAFDLIIIGSGARNTLRSRLFGSVADKVVDRSRLPVLIVR